MRKVISASRRTDFVAFFPERLSAVIKEGKVRVHGPSGHVYTVNLRPEAVHTFVLWSKNFSPLIQNKFGLKDALSKYDQLYFLFTITGLGGSFIEKEVPFSSLALRQLSDLKAIAGLPKRISIRFDPVLYWKEGNKLQTNLYFFEKLAESLSRLGIEDIRFSFCQWYGKARRRARLRNFLYVDPALDEKKEAASWLVKKASRWRLNLFSCSQNFLAEIPGIKPSACIDGQLLSSLHPSGERAAVEKDKSQRLECGCTESVDIGSYSQSCPHSCLYCYANPKMS